MFFALVIIPTTSCSRWTIGFFSGVVMAFQLVLIYETATISDSIHRRRRLGVQ